MAENLKKLITSESFRSLQERLDPWLREYNTNTCDQNLNICLELIEQVAKVQGQLFGILTAAAQEGGHNDGVETIKSRLLPWLESSFTAASLGKPVDSKVPSLQDTFDRERHKDYGPRDRDAQLESDINSTRSQLNQVQDELKSLQAQEDARHRSTDSRSSAEAKRSEPRTSEQRRSEQRGAIKRNLERNTEVASDYEKQLQTLKDEIAALSAEKSALQGRSEKLTDLFVDPLCAALVDVEGAGRGKVTLNLNPSSRGVPNCQGIVLFIFKVFWDQHDAYSQARLDAQCLLRRCIDKAETVQRIIYVATVEAFHVAKMAFRHFKIRVRKSLTPTYAGSNDFENAVMDYIICHLDLYDSQSSVNDVVRAMNVNPKISFPPEVDFCVLSDFIQEICCIAFAMQALEPPLDIAFGADGEIFNDCKYRRSYDSDFTAPLVFYHVWPALMENDCVIMKGEAVTRRGAFGTIQQIRGASLGSLSYLILLGSLFLFWDFCLNWEDVLSAVRLSNPQLGVPFGLWEEEE
ncbi:Mitochondria-eating protein [Tupaia chinensis]|uniref:Mitochondria-eating protein n=1 Tax=Tupaia chinensis TaxID=246437 RepID=L8YE41_TUPCH|nr:Mitochondria-eating protein [Tupaia chinensis]